MKRALWRNDTLMASLAIASIALVYWVDSGNLSASAYQAILWIDLALVVWFFADWWMLLREASDKRRWLIRNSWRLLGMVPLMLNFAGFLRILRLARLASVLMRIKVVRGLVKRVQRQFQGTDLGPVAAIAASITIVGGLLVWLAERNHNPNMASLTEAMWWSVVTVTTVGYGDLTPITAMGRTVAIFLMLTGIGTIGLLASQVGSAIVARGTSEPAAHLQALRDADLVTAEEVQAIQQRINASNSN